MEANLDRKDDRLDAALAFVLAFSVLGAVWLYATQPWHAGASLWPAPKAETAAAAAVPVAPAAVEPDAAAPAPVVRVEESAATVPALIAPAPAVVAAAPAVVAPAAVVPPPPPVVEAPAPAVVVAAAPAPVVEVAPSAPAVVAVAPPAPAPVAAAPKVVVRENIRFAVNSSLIPEADKARLDEIAKLLASDPRNLKIAGHSDNSGPRGPNIALSLKRAQAVRAYLVSKGAAPERLKAVGMGPDQPIGDNKTDAGRAQNRRIDITE